MPDSDREHERGRNREERLEFIREWAEYVRTHPADDWGEQVNDLVDAQLRSAQHFEDEVPTRDELHESSLLKDS